MTWASLPVRSWTCGHPRTPENTQAIGGWGGHGRGRIACRICRRRIARESATRLRVHKRGPHHPLAAAPDAR